ncbi:MAG: helix-turn-helix domain-containing protein [Micropepsaceae bacterium]
MLVLKSKREWLKGRLRENNSSFAQVARELGVSPSAVTHAVSGRYKSRMIIEALAQRVGVEPQEISPSEQGGPKQNKKL